MNLHVLVISLALAAGLLLLVAWLAPLLAFEPWLGCFFIGRC
jgi:hypothetical protein